jgi:hypothetical protein
VPTVEPEGRVLVTATIRDYEPIPREWAGEDLHPPWAATDTLVSRGPGSTHRLRQFSDSSKNARRSASEPVSSSRTSRMAFAPAHVLTSRQYAKRERWSR